MILCGVVILPLTGCDEDPAPESNTSSGATAEMTGLSTGAASTGAAASTSASSGGEVSATVGESDSDTDGPGDPFDCEGGGGVLITEFEADLPVFQVAGDDIPTTPLGTICMFPTATSWVLRLQFGAMMDGEDWASTLRVQVEDSGTYDLGSDFGEPGSGISAPNALSYGLQEGAGTTAFDTSNQSADGTLQVDSWPEESGDALSVRGDGNIAGADGWRFQFSISTVLP